MQQGAAYDERYEIMTAKQSPKAVTAAPVEAPVQHYGIGALIEATGANGKDVRRWLRSQAKALDVSDTLPGKGGRYAFTAAHVEALAKAYSTSKARKGTSAPADAIVSALSASE